MINAIDFASTPASLKGSGRDKCGQGRVPRARIEKKQTDREKPTASIADGRKKKLDKLSKTLDGLKPKLSGDDYKREAEQRKKVLAAVDTFGRARYELGEELASWRSFFKEERTWSRVCVEIGQALDCDEKTVRRTIEDFEQARVVSGLERAAAKNCHIQLEARKNRPILYELVRMLETKGPAKDEKEAEQRVAEAMRLAIEAKNRKRPAKTTTGLSVPEQQVFDLYHGLRTASEGVKPQERVTAVKEAVAYYLRANNCTEKIEITPTVAPTWVMTGRNIPITEKK